MEKYIETGTGICHYQVYRPLFLQNLIEVGPVVLRNGIRDKQWLGLD